MSTQGILVDPELWVVDVLALQQQPIEFFALEKDDFELQTNLSHCGATPEQVRSCLLELRASDYIDSTASQIEEVFDRALTLETLIQEGSNGSLGITARGAAAWEAVRSPNWSRFNFARFSVDDNGEDVLSVAAPCEDRVREITAFVSIKNFLTAKCHIPPAMRKACPFKATYWKTLAEGFVIDVPMGKPETQWLTLWADDSFFSEDVTRWYSGDTTRVG